MHPLTQVLIRSILSTSMCASLTATAYYTEIVSRDMALWHTLTFIRLPGGRRLCRFSTSRVGVESRSHGGGFYERERHEKPDSSGYDNRGDYGV